MKFSQDLRGVQHREEPRCWILTERIVRWASMFREDVQVWAGGEPQDHVFEGAEPPGDAAGVAGGGAVPVQVGGQAGYGLPLQCSTRAESRSA